MSTTEVTSSCPSCASVTPGPARFCGRCGALVRPREPTPREQPREAPAVAIAPVGADLDQHDGDDRALAAPGSRRRTVVVVAVGIAVALAAAAVVRPPAEVVTADGLRAPDGSGRTSTHAVTELTPLWSTPWNGATPQRATVVAAHDLGALLVVATDTELIALLHPSRLAGRDPPPDGVNLGGSLDPVLWRSAVVAGTPHLVDGRLPVVAGRELLWLSARDGAVVARHELTDAAGRAGPAFAVPAGELLLSADGTSAFTPEGEGRWRSDAPGPAELVGTAGDVVVVRHGHELTGRSVATGEVAWQRPMSGEGRVAARLVDGLVVATEIGGRVAVLDPATGTQVGGVRVGPAPANGPAWDGETSIVGTTATDVFVRLDAHIGIRYVRVAAGSGRIVADLTGLADQDLRTISEHAGYLLTAGWDAVTVHGGEREAWDVLELEAPAVVSGGWIVTGDGSVVVVGVDGTPTSVSVTLGDVVGVARPAVRGGHAIATTVFGLQALDLVTGEAAWTEHRGSWACCPAQLVTDDAIVLTAPVQVLEADGTLRWQDQPAGMDGPHAAAVAPPWVVTRYTGRTGAPVALLRGADGAAGPELDVTELSGIVTDGSVLAGVTRGDDDTATVVAYDVPSARTTGGSLAPRWSRPTGADTELVSAGGELLAVGAAAVEHLDPATGELRRSTPLPALGMGPVAVADGRLVRSRDAHTLEVVELASGASWVRRFELPLVTAPTIAGDVVYVADAKSVVFGLAIEDGRTVASVSVREPGLSGTTVAGGVLLAAGADRLHAFGPAPTPGTAR